MSARGKQRLLTRVGEGQWYIPVAQDQFVHFTTASRAQAILADGKLLMRPPVKKFGSDSVDAVSLVYGQAVPGVQFTHLPVTVDDPLVAIIFQTDTVPDYGHVEEVKWHQDVDLKRPELVSAQEALRRLRRTPETLPEDDQVRYRRPQGESIMQPAPYYPKNPWLPIITRLGELGAEVKRVRNYAGGTMDAWYITTGADSPKVKEFLKQKQIEVRPDGRLIATAGAKKEDVMTFRKLIGELREALAYYTVPKGRVDFARIVGGTLGTEGEGSDQKVYFIADPERLVAQEHGWEELLVAAVREHLVNWYESRWEGAAEMAASGVPGWGREEAQAKAAMKIAAEVSVQVTPVTSPRTKVPGYKVELGLSPLDIWERAAKAAPEKPVQYASLNDAAQVTDEPRLGEGNTGIWYMNRKGWELFNMGPSHPRGPLPQSEAELKKTHVKLGGIAETEVEAIFGLMQGETWSPRGEARTLIRKLGLDHTSMSVGDIVQKGRQFWMVDGAGFQKIN